MIPRHRPPFSLSDVLATLFASPKTISVEMLEDAYSAATGLPFAILLPSARAGICWALRTVVNAESTIIGPAYTCAVVHEAMARSGSRLRFMDTQTDSFLMDTEQLSVMQSENSAIILSEVYGYAYEPYSLHSSGSPLIRIFDSAMTVPVPQLFERLQGNDFSVVSFGLGKCVYAGWGAIGITKANALAREIRAQRQSALQKSNLLLLLRRGAEILLRTVAHSRIFYGTCQKFRSPPLVHHMFPPTWCRNVSLSEEWYLPSTEIDRRLALYNLKHNMRFHEQKRVLAQYYQENLRGVDVVTTPPLPPYAMSHYPIRVPQVFRDSIQSTLLRLGVDAGTLFRFAGYLSETEFPNAARISREVLNLPLDASLTRKDVDYICASIIRGVSQMTV